LKIKIAPGAQPGEVLKIAVALFQRTGQCLKIHEADEALMRAQLSVVKRLPAPK